MERSPNMRQLFQLDVTNSTSDVRELEMIVDRLLNNHPYTIQFWKDVNLYSLNVAYEYMEDFLESADSPKVRLANFAEFVTKCISMDENYSTKMASVKK